MKKRIILLLLALVACVQMKADVVNGINYSFYESDSTAIVIDKRNKYTGSIVIPSTVKSGDITYRVISIDMEAFRGCSGLWSVVISEGVRSIGAWAFWGCSGLTSVVIPGSVTKIGFMVFAGCSSLTSVVIPEGVTSIGSQAFQDCSGLTSVAIPSSVTSISSTAFLGCSGLTSVVVDANNTTYDSRNNCNAIIMTATNVLYLGFKGSTIPEGVTSIGDYAFSGCSGLTSVVIPEGVTSIGGSAFYGCSGLTSVVIPEGVTSIGDDAFSGCSGLTSVVIPEGVTSIGGSAFYGCSGLTSVVIPAGVTSIGRSAFSGCSGLTSVVVDPNNPTYDSRNNCNAIIVTVINQLVLGFNCSTIPESVTSIENWAFEGCSGLTSLVIPESVTSIENWAFKGCSDLKTLRIKGLVLDSYEFLKDLNSDCTVYVKLLFDGINNDYKCSIVSEYPVTTSPTGYTVRGEGLPVVLNCTFSDMTFTVSSATPSFFLGGLRPSTTRYLSYSFTTADGREYTCSAYPLTLPELEFTTLNPSVVSSGCAIVAANTNISDKETSVGFQWRKTTAPDDVPSKEAYTAIYDGRLEGYIKNLQTDVYYRTRPFYKAADGTYYYGEWIGFDPSDFTYFEPTVHTYPVENLTDEEASVRGYVLPGTDEVKTQGFEYWPTNGTSPAPRRVYAKAPATDVSVVFAKGQVMTATLTGLRPQTDYTYRAFVETTTGQTTYGEEQTFTTPVPTGITTIEADEPETTVAGYYDLSGRRIEEPLAKGITIIRYADGTSRKIMRR